MQLLDGKYVSEKLKVEIAEEAAKILEKTGRKPHLVAVLVGHDGGSETYVASKMKNCEKVGFKSSLVRYEDDVTEEELLKKLKSSMLILISTALSYNFRYQNISILKR